MPDRSAPGSSGPRLNVLLSYGGWRDDPVVRHLARLLDPLGIRSIHVDCCDHAAQAIRDQQIHIAVVDLSIPLHHCPDEPRSSVTPGGQRILQLLRRLDLPPPTVVVRPPQPTTRDSSRSLAEALREGAFAVLDHPLHLESMLEVMRRIVHRHYADCWPS